MSVTIVDAATCPAGQGPNTSGGCDNCPEGKYSASLSISSCTSCPVGRYSGTPSATSADTCVLCEVGKHSAVAASASCDVCTAIPGSNNDVTSCGLICHAGEGGTTRVPTGQLPESNDGELWLTDYSGNNPSFDSSGRVSGRISLDSGGIFDDNSWDNLDALVACRQIARDRGYAQFSGTALYGSATATPYYWAYPDRTSFRCNGDEETLLR